MSRSARSSLRAVTRSEEQTERLGRLLAPRLPPGTVVGLVGPLGCGKTCMARGLAAGLGVDRREVASPSFVYLVEYRPRPATLVTHADLYRLADLPAHALETVLEEIGLPAAMEESRLTIVEWWDRFPGADPESLLRVEFDVESSEHRSIVFSAAGRTAEALMEAVAESVAEAKANRG